MAQALWLYKLLAFDERKQTSNKNWGYQTRTRCQMSGKTAVGVNVIMIRSEIG